MQKGNDQQPVMAQAVPVTYASAPSAPTVVNAQQEGVVHATYVAPQNDSLGVCRRCRREFVRRPGVNDGQAQYYRCDDCESHRLSDMVWGSCSVC